MWILHLNTLNTVFIKDSSYFQTHSHTQFKNNFIILPGVIILCHQDETSDTNYFKGQKVHLGSRAQRFQSVLAGRVWFPVAIRKPREGEGWPRWNTKGRNMKGTLVTHFFQTGRLLKLPPTLPHKCQTHESVRNISYSSHKTIIPIPFNFIKIAQISNGLSV